MRKALVTGGAGFLGRAMTRHLIEYGYDVLLFDKSSGDETLKHQYGDILHLEQVQAAIEGVEVVFHLAGLLGTTELLCHSQEAVDVNIKGTLNVLEACRIKSVRRVFVPTKPNDWLNTYSITKKAGEDFARMYAAVHGMDIRILRWLNAYGPAQKAYPVRKAVPAMILQGLQGANIEVWGTGEQPVDLIFAEDLARNTVLYTLRDGLDATVRDTGNTIRMSVNQMASMIRDMTGSKAPIRHLPMRLGEDQATPVQLLPGETAADLLGLSTATTSLHTGLARTIEWYIGMPEKMRNDALAFFSRNASQPTRI